MIVASGLTKKFGPLTAVDNVDLSVGAGEVLGFLGPNGAGKTTTMRMVTGFLPITSGTATVCGFDVESQPTEIKKKIGYLPEGAPLYGDMTPIALFNFVAGVRGLSGSDKNGKIDAAIEKLELASVANRPIDTLSKGYKRRVGLAQAILHDPEVLILDEPTDGLDPNQKHDVRELINRMRTDKAIIISTHLLEEVDAVCTRAIIIARGRVVFDGTPDTLEARSPTHNAVVVRLRADAAPTFKTVLEGLTGVARVESAPAIDGMVELTAIPADGHLIVEPVSTLIHEKGIVVEGISVERGKLDDVFREITRAA